MHGLSPSRCYFTLKAHLLPCQVFNVISFLETSEVQLVQISNTVVLSLASSKYENRIVIDTRRMEPPSPRPHYPLHLDLPPGQTLKVVKPQISQILHPFSSEHYQIREAELRSMIGPFPRGWLVLKGEQFNPLQTSEIHHKDRIEALFIEPSASKHQELVGVGVVVERCVGSRRGCVSKGSKL